MSDLIPRRSLNQLYRMSNAFRDFLENYIVSKDDPRYSTFIENIKISIQDFIETVEKIPPLDRGVFIKENESKLYRIYDCLVGSSTKILLKEHLLRDKLRNVVDKLYSKIFNITNPSRYFNFYPTKVFDEFIKGITKFKEDSESGTPTYHRPSSCGSAKIPPIETFSFRANDTIDERTKRLNALETCIVERKIYESIYHTLLHEQDVAHKKILKQLENLYMDMTREQIIVEVFYRDFVIPYLVKVVFVNKNKMITYEKHTDGKVIVKHHRSLKSQFQVQSVPLSVASLYQGYNFRRTVSKINKTV